MNKKDTGIQSFISKNAIWAVLIIMVLIMNFLIYMRLGRWAFLTPQNIQIGRAHV